MQNFKRALFPCLAGLLGLISAQDLFAWGPEGHRVVGQLALPQVQPGPRQALESIMATTDTDAIAQACNWPDEYRATEEGKWSAPYHYINVPKQEKAFVPDRDCRDEVCVAGAIRKYAAELADSSIPSRQRWEAWGRVCHFTGDLHQPLHAGYVEDRGGNDFLVEFNGQEMRLHAFWDSALIKTNYPDEKQLVQDLAVLADPPVATPWRAGDADAWARESHHLVRTVGYPESKVISREFAASSWRLERERLLLASERLSQIINTVLAGQ